MRSQLGQLICCSHLSVCRVCLFCLSSFDGLTFLILRMVFFRRNVYTVRWLEVVGDLSFFLAVCCCRFLFLLVLPASMCRWGGATVVVLRLEAWERREKRLVRKDVSSDELWVFGCSRRAVRVRAHWDNMGLWIEWRKCLKKVKSVEFWRESVVRWSTINGLLMKNMENQNNEESKVTTFIG